MHRQAALGGIIVASLVLLLSPLQAASPKRDYASAAWTILPPGENGSLAFDRNTNDQAKLYDGLTRLGGNVTARDLRRYFKPAPLGLGADTPRKRERPRPGVTIVRDSFGVAHVTGKTEADVAFGAGWVTAADRGLLLQLIRGPARIAALDVPGLDPLALALGGKSFVPSVEAEAFLSNQVDAVRAQGAIGRRVLTIANAYAAGINRWYAAKGIPNQRFTVNDVIAASALIAARFGANGGQEVQNSMFLDALEERLGAADARRVFADLREANDPEAPPTVPGSFPYELPPESAPGSVVVDDGSFTGAPLEQPPFASSAILIGAKRSQTAHPLFVAGPQVGYFFPEFFAEMELSGAGFATRGAVFPGVPFVVIGRGPDFAWSATSSQADNIDLFAETLCDDDRHYLYRGRCEPMRRFFVGTLKAQGQPDQQISYYETAHGPLVGYATVGGKKVGIALQRSTRGREILSSRAFYELNTGRVTSAKSFLRTMSAVEFSFNWFYADDRDIAFFSSGRLPQRASGTDPALPTIGTGEYDWAGFLPADAPRAGSQSLLGSDPQLEQQGGCQRGRGRLELLLRLGTAGRATRTRDCGAEKAHARHRHRCDEQGGHPGSARAGRLADRPRGARDRRGAERQGGGGSRTPRFLAHARRGASGSRLGREDRRARSGRHGRCLAGSRRCRARARPRTSRRPVGCVDGEERRRRPEWLRVHLRLVRLRGQGPAHAARTAGPR